VLPANQFSPSASTTLLKDDQTFLHLVKWGGARTMEIGPIRNQNLIF